MAADAWAGRLIRGRPSLWVDWKGLTVCPPWWRAAYGEAGNMR
jgi:hypothetical protein